MKRLIVALGSCAILLAGCDAGKDNRLMWSPDGKHLAIASGETIRLGDDAGKLSSVELKNIHLFRWAPDSVHAVIVTSKDLTSWKDVRTLLSDKERRNIELTAAKLWQTNSRSTWERLGADFGSAGLVYLKDKYGERSVNAKIGRIFKDWTPEQPKCSVSILQLIDCSAEKPTFGAPLFRSIEDIDDLRLSPSGRLAAVSIDNKPAHKIVAVPLKGGQPLTVAESLAKFPDWCSDSRSLFYVAKPLLKREDECGCVDAKRNPVVGMLCTCAVAGANDQLLPKAGPVKELAEVLVENSSRVRCLPDGSIVFDAIDRPFPGIKKTKETNALFRLTPDFKSVAKIETAAGLPDDLAHFVPSPDGTKIAVPGSKGEVVVLDVATGALTRLESAGKKDLKFAPAWRTNDELCFAAPISSPMKGGREAEVVVQSLSSPDHRVVLSKDWPVAAFDYLKFEEESKASDQKVLKSQPAHHRHKRSRKLQPTNRP